MILTKIIQLLLRKRRSSVHTPVFNYKANTASSQDDSLKLTTDFYSNLRKTIGWTQNITDTIVDTDNMDYLSVLRSAVPHVPCDYEVILSTALAGRPEQSLSTKNIAELGKILRFVIDITTCDGTPYAEKGFVDQADIPPIDTWFYLTKEYLYCWIPMIFVDQVQKVMDVEAFVNYEWLEKLDPVINKKIEKGFSHRQLL